MTLNGVMAVILCYFSKFAYLPGVLRKNSRSLSHLLMSSCHKCVIRPVVEYGCVVWHHNLTTAQSDRLEALQTRALRIILHTITLPYNTALAYCEIESLKLCIDVPLY